MKCTVVHWNTPTSLEGVAAVYAYVFLLSLNLFISIWLCSLSIYLSIYIYIYIYRIVHFYISLKSRVFAGGPEDRGSVLGRVIAKIQKLVLDDALHSTQYYKVRIKGKVEQSREWGNALSQTEVQGRALVHCLIEKGAFESPSTKID